MQVWRLRGPLIRHPQAGEPGSQWCDSARVWRPENLRANSLSLSPKAQDWRSRKGGVCSGISAGLSQKPKNLEHRCPRAGEMACPNPKRANSLFLSFCSIQALNRLDNACPHYPKPSSSLGLLIQRLISLKSTLSDLQKWCFTSYPGNP